MSDNEQGRRIRTGDVVLHAPTGEQWIVAYADYDNEKLAWCGWPGGLANLSDCELVAWCDDDESEDILRDLANMATPDHRRDWARRVLADAS